MLTRHYILEDGFKVDRDWWFTTKLVAVIVVALVAAYVVNATLL